MLRCVEKLAPTQIRHIPRVLYHWRMVEGSAAAASEAKPYAPEAARRAIADHLQRKNVGGKAGRLPRESGVVSRYLRFAVTLALGLHRYPDA